MDRGFTCPVGRLRRREEEAAEGEQEGEEREEEGGEARGGGDRESRILCSVPALSFQEGTGSGFIVKAT